MSDDIWPRPCLVDGERRAVCWDLCQLTSSRSDGTVLHATPVLVVEYEDGGFASLQLERVTMLDSDKLFGSYCWEAGDE